MAFFLEEFSLVATLQSFRKCGVSWTEPDLSIINVNNTKSRRDEACKIERII